MSAGEALVVGRILAVHDLWASGYITTRVWWSRYRPLATQLQQARSDRSGYVDAEQEDQREHNGDSDQSEILGSESHTRMVLP